MASNPYNAPMQSQQSPSGGGTRLLHIKEVDVMSLGILNGAFGVCIGLLVGFIFALVTIVGALAGGNAVVGILFGVGAIIIAPAFYGFLMFVGGCISALLYNFVAGMAGGVKIRVEV